MERDPTLRRAALAALLVVATTALPSYAYGRGLLGDIYANVTHINATTANSTSHHDGNSTTNGPNFYAIAILGDSLSDTGNVFRAAGLPDLNAGYSFGRFSNGLVWPEYLHAALASANRNTSFAFWNYANGGATACPPTHYPYVKDLSNQTQQLLADLPTAYLPPGAKLLPIQFISANDLQYPLISALKTGKFPSPEELAALIGEVISCRLSSATTLASSGAAPDIVLLPTGPLWLMPAVPAPYKPAVQALITNLDQALAGAVAAVQQQWQAAPEGSPLRSARLHLLGNSTWMGMEGVGAQVKPPFTNTTSPCLPNTEPMARVPANVVAQVCEDPSSYMFWDVLHPTTRYHQAFALYGVLPRLRAVGLLPVPDISAGGGEQVGRTGAVGAIGRRMQSRRL